MCQGESRIVFAPESAWRIGGSTPSNKKGLIRSLFLLDAPNLKFLTALAGACGRGLKSLMRGPRFEVYSQSAGARIFLQQIEPAGFHRARFKRRAFPSLLVSARSGVAQVAAADATVAAAECVFAPVVPSAADASARAVVVSVH